MKVLQLSKFYWPVMGGIEAVAWELTEGLNRAGIPTDVLCSHQRPRTLHERAPAGYEVVRAAAFGRLQSTSVAPVMVPLLRRMSRGRDIIHVHMPDPMAALAVWLTRPRAHIVVHWHSDVIRQRRAMRLYEPLQRWLLERADAVIATSQAYAEASTALQAWRDKIEVIPIGIGDVRSEACERKAAALRQRFRGRRIVFALGRMTYYKGFDVLIDAAAALPEDSVVIIGGEGELLEHYRSLVLKLGLSGKVHLVGHVTDGELASHFEACDVFCMPSTVRSEAYGVAMVEALALGRPVVATDIAGSGVPWVNQHGLTGLNVPVRDPAALAAALSRILADEPLRRSMGSAARLRYEQECSAAVMTRRTIDLYRRIA